MATKHSFNFDGGLTLSKMGASWFISYTYYLTIDKYHKNWALCETVDMRKSFFYSSQKYHSFWLTKILQMNPKKLNSNLLILKGEKVINMTKKIIAKNKSSSSL